MTAEELEDPLVLWDTGWATAGEEQIQGRQKSGFPSELGLGGLVYAERNRERKAQRAQGTPVLGVNSPDSGGLNWL